MQPSNFLKDLTQRLCDALPDNLQVLKKDLEKNIHGILSNTFTKLDLISREEFDAQTKVLARTRKKIEALEQQVAELEKSLQQKSTRKK